MACILINGDRSWVSRRVNLQKAALEAKLAELTSKLADSESQRLKVGVAAMVVRASSSPSIRTFVMICLSTSIQLLDDVAKAKVSAKAAKQERKAADESRAATEVDLATARAEVGPIREPSAAPQPATDTDHHAL